MKSNNVNPIPKVKISNLSKIFGDKPQDMLLHVRNGMNKADLLANHGHVLGLQDINVDIQASEITVVMGLSGSGKSTLIRHLNRLIEPTSGEIVIDGKDIMKMSKNDLNLFRQNKMSMVFQNFALFPHRTVLQNIALPLQVRGMVETERDQEAEKWLERAGLSGYGGYYPHQLSGGMQQRVGLARALASNCDIMLMDEAFSALDPLIRTDMQDLLLELQKELHKTIVFITHDLDEALKLSDHLVILNNGAVVQQGEPQSILMNPSDSYIEAFISDINRARVLRVRSVMTALNEGEVYAGDVYVNDNLESLISLSEGDTKHTYRVLDNDVAVGQIDMGTIIRALVPKVSDKNNPIL
mgnify:FL=1